ncbi:MAG: hypothetical protein LIO77_04010 [Rikenellaceae bacterium]|nr:hypothetical protein [Rikenellaceae bacterium]
MKRLFAALLLGIAALLPVRSQGLYPITAESLIYYFEENFDVWEEAMEAHGLRSLDSSVARDQGPLYIFGTPPDNYLSMSKDSEQISVQAIQSGAAEPILAGLFGEIIDGGRHVGSQLTYAFGKEIKIDYYLYEGYWFGIHLSDHPDRLEETVYVIEPFQ